MAMSDAERSGDDPAADGAEEGSINPALAQRETAGAAGVMENVYLPKAAVLDRVVDEIHEVKTFYWHFEDAAEQAAFRRFRPGQFAQVSLFGVGEFPTSLPPTRPRRKHFLRCGRWGRVRPRCMG